ncbi:MAG: DUF4197 domain-containing protein [Cytophagales bacterium]|nr:DUF4197 domain-containing protein [Cytophagales bacterium]
MKKFLTILSLFTVFTICACGQINLNKFKNAAEKAIKGEQPLTNDEIISGLKEALTVGTNNSTASASKMDGYFKNSEIKIPYPPEAAKMEQKLRSMGMNKQVDDFVMSLNRAAEEAAKEAAPIFVTAVTNMTITDGMKILKGEDDAATTYLNTNTSGQLYDKFKPVVQKAIQKVKVTQYWNPLVTAYNKIPLVEKMNPDIEDYTTHKCIDGLFILIATEELKIRKDPAARVSEILKKVFGG